MESCTIQITELFLLYLIIETEFKKYQKVGYMKNICILPICRGHLPY